MDQFKFYGSIQIFQYLKFNGIELNSNLWLYLIHGRNAELIHLLEDNHINPNDLSYMDCITESINSFYNDIFNYFEINFVKNVDAKMDSFFDLFLKYYNFSLIYLKLNINETTLIKFCEHNYYTMVKLIINNDINGMRI